MISREYLSAFRLDEAQKLIAYGNMASIQSWVQVMHCSARPCNEARAYYGAEGIGLGSSGQKIPTRLAAVVSKLSTFCKIPVTAADGFHRIYQCLQQNDEILTIA